MKGQTANKVMFDEMLKCPRCDEKVIRVIQQVGKPTQYFHRRNNQEDLMHEDLTADMKK